MKSRIMVFVIFAFLISLIIYFQLQPQTPALHDDMLIMNTESMRPTIYQGDYLKIDTKVRARDIVCGTKDSNQTGDIIVFMVPSQDLEFIAHRAVQMILDEDGNYSFKTWGDNNVWPDGWIVEEKDIIGKVIEIIPASN